MVLTALLSLLSPICDTRISTCRGSASSSHRSPPCAPGGYSLNSLFKWIASCTSLIQTLGPITAVVLTNKCFPNSSRIASHSDLRPLKEKSPPQRTNLTIRTRHVVFTSERHSSRHVTCALRCPTQMLNFPSDIPITFIFIWRCRSERRCPVFHINC